MEPERILTWAGETPAQISKRTKIDIHLLCPLLVSWWKQGRVIALELGQGDWSIPGFRLRAPWDGPLVPRG
jgi:hypothetical protein